MFVLVHGAGMGANCWDRLLPFLDRSAHAVDLPGRGSRSDVPLESVTLEDCAKAILDDCAGISGDDLVLVAHSFAGVSVPRVMAELAPRLRHVVFLSAVVPPDLQAALDARPDARSFFAQLDGELAGQLPLTAEVVPDALTLLVPTGYLAKERSLVDVPACA